jgi:hypothetical protein
MNGKLVYKGWYVDRPFLLRRTKKGHVSHKTLPADPKRKREVSVLKSAERKRW